jgi:hypothetical protein
MFLPSFFGMRHSDDGGAWVLYTTEIKNITIMGRRGEPVDFATIYGTEVLFG